MAFIDNATGVKLVPRKAPSAPPAVWVPKKPAATHAGAAVAAPPADAAANSSSPQLRHTDHEAAAAVAAAGDENDDASSVGTFRTVAGDSAGVSDVGDDDASAADASAAVAADDISPPNSIELEESTVRDTVPAERTHQSDPRTPRTIGGTIGYVFGKWG